MSHKYYNELWLVTRNDLGKILKFEETIQEASQTESKSEALNSALTLYLKYRNLVKRLITCYDQIVQSQKRDLLRRVLSCAIGRLLECKSDVVNQKCSDYLWPYEIMNRLKFVPEDITIRVSGIREENTRKRMNNVEIASILQRLSTESGQKMSREELSEERLQGTQENREELIRKAILLIQNHERARAARYLASYEKHHVTYKQKLEDMKGSDVAYRAATKIQSVWRGFMARRAYKERIDKIERLLDMTMPSKVPKEVAEIFRKDKDNMRRRRELIPIHAERTEKVVDEERDRLLQVRAPSLFDDITEEIREWFLLWYNELGYFDVYPAAALGGSILMATGATRTPQEFLTELTEAGKKADKGKPEKRKGKKKAEKKTGRKMASNQNFLCLEKLNKEFVEDWSLRNEDDNRDQKDYMDLISNKLCYQLQLEVRQAVDELMRLELRKLNEALKKDYAMLGKKFSIPTLQGGKGKKRRRRARGKSKRRKNIVVSEDEVKSFLEELVTHKIVKSYPRTSLNDWFGDLSYRNVESSLERRDYDRRLGDVRETIVEYCVLPMISRESHETSPLIRAVCIAGLPMSGKSFLVNAICSEIGALLLDVSPQILLKKYYDARQQKKLIKMIFSIAPLVAPLIIFLDNGEKFWLKRAFASEGHWELKRFAKFYVKLIKSIKPGDQILFISTTSEPYKAGKAFVKLHDKFVTIPATDYASLYLYYSHLLSRYDGVDRNFDVSCLARASVGAPLVRVRETLEKVVSPARRISLKYRPLLQAELMNELLGGERHGSRNVTNFQKFAGRIPFKKRY